VRDANLGRTQSWVSLAVELQRDWARRDTVQAPGRPATAHFRLAGHPVVRWYEPGEDWYWYYLDRLVFELGGAPAAPSQL